MKNGVVLCHLINKIAGPNSVKKINERGSNFQLMENIQRLGKNDLTLLTSWVNSLPLYFFFLRGSRFQTAIRKYGVGDEEIFQTADLFERRNIRQVCLCLHALARTVRHIIPSFF